MSKGIEGPPRIPEVGQYLAYVGVSKSRWRLLVHHVDCCVIELQEVNVDAKEHGKRFWTRWSSRTAQQQFCHEDGAPIMFPPDDRPKKRLADYLCFLPQDVIVRYSADPAFAGVTGEKAKAIANGILCKESEIEGLARQLFATDERILVHLENFQDQSDGDVRRNRARAMEVLWDLNVDYRREHCQDRARKMWRTEW